MPDDLVVSLPVADRPRASAFYRRFLDREPPGEPQDDGEPEPLQFELGPGCRLMLVPEGGFGWVIGEERQVADAASTEVILSLTAPDEAGVDRLAQVAVEAGGSVVSAPAQQPWGYSATVADPDSHLWQVLVL
jgi:predicted lactoylglutathione lyase